MENGSEFCLAQLFVTTGPCGEPFGSSALGPIETCFASDAFVKLAQQAADDIPPAGAADFDIALAIDTHDRIAVHARGMEVVMMQLIIGHDLFERGAGHFDKGHDAAFSQ